VFGKRIVVVLFTVFAYFDLISCPYASNSNLTKVCRLYNCDYMAHSVEQDGNQEVSYSLSISHAMLANDLVVSILKVVDNPVSRFPES
jgi:hypothetical protein